MKDNRKPTLIPLFLVIAGSCLLALPGAYGAMFLFMIAFENGAFEPLSLLFPLPPIIGFSLLFGYIWTAVTRRFLWWLWSASFLFNLIVSFIALVGAAVYLVETPSMRASDGYEKLFILFPLWTTFVAGASAYYFFQSRAANNCDLP